MSEPVPSEETVVEKRRVREVAAVFHRAESLENAIQDLLRSGFDRADVDIMSDVETVRRHLGTFYVPPAEVADISGTPRRAFVARDDIEAATPLVAGMLFYLGAVAAVLGVVASGGSLAIAAAAAAAGGTIGGGLGATAVHLLGKKQAQDLEEQLKSGGIVIWVRVRDPEHEAKAQEILVKHGAEAIRVHEIEIEKRLEDLPLAKLRPDPWLGDEPLAHT